MISGLTTKIFASLGNNSSLLPIAVKDVAHTTGMSTASYITGKEVEGKDRFIDEAGTALIWIGGIPFYKKLIDLTLYKITGYNPKVDVRLLKDKKIIELAQKYAPTPEIKKSIEHAAEKATTFKGLAMTKFIASTFLTLASYWALTNYRHKQTEKAIVKEFHKEVEVKKANTAFAQKQKSANPAFKQHNPSFGNSMNALKAFMFDPVKNMMIVDGGITAERLSESRNPQDFMGYVIKEGSFWAFMYIVGAKIQKHFENKSEQKHNKSIDLDIRILQSAELKGGLKVNDSLIDSSVAAFKKIKTPEQIYEFICTQKDNLVVEMAKKSDIIKTHKATGKVDTQQFIDLDAVKGVGDKLEKLSKQFKASGENIETFIEKTMKLKEMSIIKNIGTCVGVLGLVVPGIMLGMRYMNKDNKEFAVKKEIHEKLKKEHNLA